MLPNLGQAGFCSNVLGTSDDDDVLGGWVSLGGTLAVADGATSFGILNLPKPLWVTLKVDLVTDLVAVMDFCPPGTGGCSVSPRGTASFAYLTVRLVVAFLV